MTIRRDPIEHRQEKHHQDWEYDYCTESLVDEKKKNAVVVVVVVAVAVVEKCLIRKQRKDCYMGCQRFHRNSFGKGEVALEIVETVSSILIKINIICYHCEAAEFNYVVHQMLW